MNWDKDTPLVIVSHYYNNERSDVLSRDWIYQAFMGSPVVLFKKGVDVPEHGYMASTYLKFLFENYDNLPKSMFFIDGEIEAWHQNNYRLVTVPKRLTENKEVAEKYPYVNINSTDFDDRILGKNHAMNLLFELWDEYFREYFQRDCPTYVRDVCCSQFVLQRSAVEKIPKETIQKWYELSINEQYESILIDRVFEYIWHMIFGQPDIIKPSDRNKRDNEIENIFNEEASKAFILMHELMKEDRLKKKDPKLIRYEPNT